MEQRITELVLNDPEMKELLTSYGGQPAFFYQKAPLDHDPHWNLPCFPRVDFDIAWNYDATGEQAGVLNLHISVCNSSVADVEKRIENRFLELFHGTFFSPKQEVGVVTYSLLWESSSYFSVKGSDQNAELSPVEVYGIEMKFQVLGFPPQGMLGVAQILKTEGTGCGDFEDLSDPVLGFYRWLEQEFPKVRLISYHSLPPVWKPSYQEPALYCGFDSDLCPQRQSYSVNWYTGQLSLHLFASCVPERTLWAKGIMSRLKLQGEFLLPDGSPFFVEDVSLVPKHHPFQMGQVMIQGTYGEWVAPRKQAPCSPLRHGFYRQLPPKTMEKRKGNLSYHLLNFV